MALRLVVLIVALAAAATACGPANHVAAPHAPLSFQPSAGWFTAESTEPWPDSERPPLPRAWASNVPFVHDPAKTGWPDPTISNLPIDGIVLEAVGPWTYSGREDVPTVDFPLRLANGYCLADGYEGQPAPNVSFCAIVTRIGPEIMNAYVYFGRNEPTQQMKTAADQVLATLSISR